MSAMNRLRDHVLRIGLILCALMMGLTAHARADCVSDTLNVVLQSALNIAKMPSDTAADIRERERVLANTQTLLDKAQRDLKFCGEVGGMTGANPAPLIQGEQALWESDELLALLAAPDFFGVSSLMTDPSCKQYAHDVGVFILSNTAASTRRESSEGEDGIVRGEAQLMTAFAHRAGVDESLLQSNDQNSALLSSLQLRGTSIAPACVSKINSFITGLEWTHYGGL